MSRAAAKRLGSWIEDTIVDSIDALSPAEDPGAHYDARSVATIGHGEIPISGRLQVPIDTFVEIKGAQFRVSNGSYSTKGRYYIKRKAHDFLLDKNGVYLLCVHDPALDEQILAQRAIPATSLDDVITSWSPVNGARSENEVAKVSWSKIFDPAEIPHPDAGGGSR